MRGEEQDTATQETAKPKAEAKTASEMPAETKGTVLVTGASGFIAKHCIVKLLNEGYKVRGSLRTPGRAEAVRSAIATRAQTEHLEFVTLDLMQDAGWETACSGCDYVQHVASPFPGATPKDENELIVPARDGALRAMKAAAKAGVRRVVLTSSMAAIAYGHDHGPDYVIDEKDWSNLKAPLGAYLKSKTIAERAAWEFVESEAGQGLELSVINPGAVLGPLLDNRYSTSGEMVARFLRGQIPAIPRIGFCCIDVRDVAEAHFRAMILPEAAGRRYLCIEDFAWLSDVAKILHEAGYRVTTRNLPDWMARTLALFDKTLATYKRALGRKENCSNARLRNELGIEPRGLKEMVLSMAETMVEYGVVTPKMRQAG